MNRLFVDRLEVDPVFLPAERHTQFVHNERPAVGNGDPAADACGAEIFPPLEHLEQHAFRLFVQLEKSDELAENVVLGRPDQVEFYGVFAEKLPEFHVADPVTSEQSLIGGERACEVIQAANTCQMLMLLAL